MKQFFSIIILCTLIFSSAHAQPDKRKKEFNLNKTSLAIEGYDPVAYFTQSKAVKGNKNFALAYDGVTYHFSSQQNKDLFKAKPTSYEPQYGGWCAYAMGESGEKVEVDPETFKVTKGKLFLFYNKYFTNTLKTWNKNEAPLNTKADVNWSKFYH